MNRIHVTRLVASVLCGVTMAGCSLDPLNDNMRKELYTQSFVKNFGTIDPNQDWNQATSAVVTVQLGETVHPLVKIYGNYGSKYYLVAELENVKGTIQVPIDVPKSCTDIKVKIDDRVFFGKLFSNIDCTLQSRGVPGVNYGHNDDGDYVNPNPPVYTSSKAVGTINYGIEVKHTTRGNGGELGFTDSGEYKYFNTQQMAPVVSTEPWDRYFSLNALDWFDNPNSAKTDQSGWGILPERGVYNAKAEQISKWLNQKRTEGYQIVEDFTIATGNDGSITFFPYYYGTNLSHEIGVYFIDENDNPILKDGSAYNSAMASDYTLDHFVSFPIFNDRQHGDLQVKPNYDSRIKDIRAKKDFVFVKGQTYDLGEYVEVDFRENNSSAENWIDYNTYVTQYGAETHSRLAVHIWNNELKENGWVKFVNYHTIEALKEGETGGGIGITTSMVNTQSGKGKPNGIFKSVNFKVSTTAPVTTDIYVLESDIPETVDITIGNSVTYNITSLKRNNGNDDVWGSTNIKVTNQHSGNMTLTLDNSRKTLTIAALAVNESETQEERIYIDANNDGSYNDGETVLKKFRVVVTGYTTVDHSYSQQYATWPVPNTTWESLFRDANLSASDIILKTTFSDHINCNAYELANTLFSAVENLDEYNLAIDLNFLCSHKDSQHTECEVSLLSMWRHDLKDVDSPQTITTSTTSLIIPISADLAAQLKQQGFVIVPSSSGDGFSVFTAYLTPKNPVSGGGGDPHWEWRHNAKSAAEDLLATYYSDPAQYPSGSVNCGTHPGEQISFTASDITVGTPVVVIADEADYNTIKYTVTWPLHQRVSVSHVPARRFNRTASYVGENTSYRAPSRAGSDGRPDLLSVSNPSPWVDVNGCWIPILPQGQEVASYPPNMTMLGRSRGYDIIIKKDGVPYNGKLGLYMKVLGANYIDNSDWSTAVQNTTANYTTETYDGVTFPYVVFSQKRFNKDATRAPSSQIASLTFKHPTTGNTYLTFEDMLVTNAENTKVGDRNGSDRDVNDLIFYITNYASVSGGDREITEKDEEDEGFPWIWAVEDLGSVDDFDFNDLIVKIGCITNVHYTYQDGVVTDATATKMLTFSPQAAGGTLPLYIHFKVNGEDYVLRPGVYNITGKEVAGVPYNGEALKGRSAEAEVHRWFGSGFPYTTMINTGTGVSVFPGQIKTCSVYVPAPEYNKATSKLEGGFNLNIFTSGSPSGTTIDNKVNLNKTNYFFVSVDASSQQGAIGDERLADEYDVVNDELGCAPQSFIIMASDWRWPRERAHILDAYPDFGLWVKNSSNNTWMNRTGNSKWIY